MSTKRERAQARAMADQLAALPISDAGLEGVTAPPAFIADPLMAAALEAWKQLAPMLNERVMLTEGDRMMLALLCYHQAELIEAVKDIQARGYSVLVPTVSGGEMPRLNPSVRRRDTAVSEIKDLSVRFGLTPLDRARLARAQKDDPDAPLFGRIERPKPGAGDGDGAGAAPPVEIDEWDNLLPSSHRPN